jgi:death on curing protein
VSESPFVYLTASQVRDLHEAMIEAHGGARGWRSFAALDLCVQAPQNLAYLSRGDVFEQASAYTCSILRKSPFKDGNRRTALVAALVFLEVNGVLDHDYNQPMLLQAMTYLAEGKMDASLFALFLREAVSGSTGTWEDQSPSGSSACGRWTIRGSRS